MMNLLDRLTAARARATRGGIPMRRTDEALYGLLAEIKHICEDVTRSGAEEQLRELYWQRGLASGARRRYIEAGADVHILVSRYILDDEDTRNSTYRYALALREADKRQIRAVDLAGWLREHGGVNALYRTRETSERALETRTMHLTSPVRCTIGTPLTLTVRRRADGAFDVLSNGQPLTFVDNMLEGGTT